MPAAEGKAGGTATKTKVFISYSRKDMVFADRLEAALKAHGIEPLIDRTEIYAFEDWWKRIQALIAQADTIIFVLSHDAVSSDTCKKEVDFAASLNKRFAPIVARKVDEAVVPQQLRRLNFIFFDDELLFEPAVNRLVEALATDIEWIRKHTEIGQLARRWAEAGRPGPKGLLLRSPLLDEAERWIASRPREAPPPTEAMQALIVESRRAEMRRRNVLSGSLGAGLIVALSLAGFAYWQWGNAVERLRQAQISESRYLGARALDAALNDNVDLTKLLLSRLLPKNIRKPDRPLVAGAALAAAEILSQDALRSILPNTLGLPTFSSDGKWLLAISGTQANVWDVSKDVLALSLKGHERSVTFAGFSPDSRTILTGSADGTVRLWDGISGQLLVKLKEQTRLIKDAKFSRDGKRFVTVSYDRTARLWDTGTGVLLRTFETPDKEIYHAIFAPEGKSILAEFGRTAEFWNIETGEVQPLPGPGTWFGDAPFSTDGKLLLTGSSDGGAYIRDASTGQVLKRLRVEEEGLVDAAFSQDGTQILASSGGRASLWDVANGTLLRDFHDPDGPIGFAEFSANSQLILTTSQDHLRIWDARTGQLRRRLMMPAARVAFSPDATLVVSSSGDRWARLWDLSLGGPLRVLEPHETRLTNAVFSPDGKLVFTAQFGGAHQVWDATTGEFVRALRDDHLASSASGKSAPANVIAFSSDDHLALTSSGFNDARLWDLGSGKPLQQLSNVDSPLSTAEFSTDSTEVLTTSLLGRNVKLWDAANGRLLVTLRGHKEPVTSAHFVSKGTRILTASSDGSTRLWSVLTGEQLFVFQNPQEEGIVRRVYHPDTKETRQEPSYGRVNSAVLSRDERQVLTSSSDGYARLLDASTGHLLRLWKASKEALLSASFSPDGLLTVTLDAGGTAGIWDVATGMQLRVLNGSGLTSALFSPDGALVLAACSDSTARVFDVATGEQVGALKGHKSAVATANFSPDGKLILTASDDMTARIWAAPPTFETLIGFLRASATRSMTNAERLEVGLSMGEVPPEQETPSEPSGQSVFGRKYQDAVKHDDKHDQEKALLDFAVAVRRYEARGKPESPEAKEAMIYRANLARRLSKSDVARIWAEAETVDISSSENR